MIKFARGVLLILTSLTLFNSFQALAQSSVEVSVTNLTEGQTFTPIFVTTHDDSVRLFTLGEPAGSGLVEVAEGGDTSSLEALVDLPFITDVGSSGGLLEPGQTTSIIVAADDASHVSVVSMLIPTNDTFFAVNAAAIPAQGELVIRSPGYDAGSEPDDELCANIPGPVCGGAGFSPAVDGEGFVHIQKGIQGIGDLDPAERDWRNPVAEIVIRRIAQ